jgi:DNA repair protein RadC
VEIQVTCERVQAGRLLKLEVLDHVIIGQPRHRSLREVGYIQ